MSNELYDSLKEYIAQKPKSATNSNLSEGERVQRGARSFAEIEQEARAHRHELINGLIQDLRQPLKSEQDSKNEYRKHVLWMFSIFFVAVTIATFVVIFVFMTDGYTKAEVSVAKFLVTGLFANLVGLTIIIFKYLFDDKNSLLKDMIQLVVKTIEIKQSRED